jgi:hypothetical protein
MKEDTIQRNWSTKRINHQKVPDGNREKASISLKKSSKIIEFFIKAPHFQTKAIHFSGDFIKKPVILTKPSY